MASAMAICSVKICCCKGRGVEVFLSMPHSPIAQQLGCEAKVTKASNCACQLSKNQGCILTEKGRVGSAVRGYWLRMTKVSAVEYWVCECRSK